MLLEQGSPLRRLHALAGVVPVGGFLVFHLLANARASRGADAYNSAAQRLQAMPGLVAFEAAVILLPLAFHAIVGLFLIAATPSAPAIPAAPSTPSQRWVAGFQRGSGVFLFAFILFHLWTTRLVQIEDHASLDLFRLMQTALASPWIHLFYVGGVLAAAGHFAAGLWALARTWGLAHDAHGRAVWLATSAVAFVGLSILGFSALFAFRL